MMELTNSLGAFIFFGFIVYAIYFTATHKGLGNGSSSIPEFQVDEMSREYPIYSERGIDMAVYNDFQKKVRQLGIYSVWRANVLFRYNYTCHLCNHYQIRGLHVHHTRSMFRVITSNKVCSLNEALNCKELWDITNGEVLCSRCHENTESHQYYKLMSCDHSESVF